ncbi:MAG: hypothetical protein WAU88_10965 [Candidatus Zixiibacteriota bacterium]
MRPTSLILVILLTVLITVAGCGKSDSNQPAPATSSSDREQMQATLTEIISRWHMGDKGGLFDNEFDYVRERYTYDDYLRFRELRLDADTVDALNITDVKMFGRDSADVSVEVVFKGPTGKISKRQDHYMMFRWKDKWIRPTVSTYQIQTEWDSRKNQADSAAEAEAKELEGK